MSIEKNKAVTVHYRLKEGGEDGQLIEETFGKNPLSFIYGIGMMIPGFEANLQGKKEGESYAFLLSPEEAYGPLNNEAVVDIPIANFADPSGNGQIAGWSPRKNAKSKWAIFPRDYQRN